MSLNLLLLMRPFIQVQCLHAIDGSMCPHFYLSLSLVLSVVPRQQSQRSLFLHAISTATCSQDSAYIILYYYIQVHTYSAKSALTYLLLFVLAPPNCAPPLILTLTLILIAGPTPSASPPKTKRSVRKVTHKQVFKSREDPHLRKVIFHIFFQT